MFGWSRILFPTDLSPIGRQAFLQAASLAARTGAEVHVLHVDTEQAEGPGEEVRHVPFDEVRMRAQLQIDLQTWHTHIGAGRACRVRFVQAEQAGLPPDVAILDYARRCEADLIVMGTHGRRGLWHLLFGSVAEAVLRHAPCPVLTVRYSDPLLPVRLKHVLVPLDFSSQSGPVLADAKRLALLHRASVSLLFVAEAHLVPIGSDTGLPTVTVLQADPKIASRAEAALRQLDAATDAADVPTAYAVRHGDPAREITTFAKRHGADLIVLSRCGHSGPDGTSAVTEKVIRTAPCPVLTMPFAAPPADAPGATPAEAGHTPACTARYHHGAI